MGTLPRLCAAGNARDARAMSLEDAQERDQVRLFWGCQDEADTGEPSEQ